MLWRPPRRSWCMHRILCTACNRNSTRSFERGHDGNILEEAYRGRYARQRLLNFWPESSCGYHAIKRFVCIIQVVQVISFETWAILEILKKQVSLSKHSRPDQIFISELPMKTAIKGPPKSTLYSSISSSLVYGQTSHPVPAVPHRLALINSQGTIVAVNKEWIALAQETGASLDRIGRGANYF